MLGSAVKSVDIPVSASLNGTTNEACCIMLVGSKQPAHKLSN
jgi:hypothetical protein